MVLSPRDALASPKARLSTEESMSVAQTCNLISNALRETWAGYIFNCKIQESNIKQLGAIYRRFEEAGWIVGAMPVDGRTAKAMEILERGGSPEWMISLQPCWWRSPAGQLAVVDDESRPGPGGVVLSGNGAGDEVAVLDEPISETASS